MQNGCGATDLKKNQSIVQPNLQMTKEKKLEALKQNASTSNRMDTAKRISRS